MCVSALVATATANKREASYLSWLQFRSSVTTAEIFAFEWDEMRVELLCPRSSSVRRAAVRRHCWSLALVQVE